MLSNKDLRENFRWIRNPEQKGEHLFTFDGENIYSLFPDYPDALSKEEKDIFDEINPYWATFFNGDDDNLS